MEGERNIREVGYEGRTIEEVIRSLHTWGVSTLVDVRLNAVSRKKGFSKKALGASLEAAGVTYVHLPVLGNPKDNRAGFYSPGTDLAEQAHENFKAGLDVDAARAALDEVEKLGRQGGVALLCFERDRGQCHRDLIIQRLLERQLAVA